MNNYLNLYIVFVSQIALISHVPAEKNGPKCPPACQEMGQSCSNTVDLDMEEAEITEYMECSKGKIAQLKVKLFWNTIPNTFPLLVFEKR